MKLYPRNSKIIKFSNVGRDFKQDYIFLGKTKSGRFKLGDISSSSPEGFGVYKNRLTRVVIAPSGKRRHWVSEGGSALNSYSYDED